MCYPLSDCWSTVLYKLSINCQQQTVGLLWHYCRTTVRRLSDYCQTTVRLLSDYRTVGLSDDCRTTVGQLVSDYCRTVGVSLTGRDHGDCRNPLSDCRSTVRDCRSTVGVLSEYCRSTVGNCCPYRTVGVACRTMLHGSGQLYIPVVTQTLLHGPRLVSPKHTKTRDIYYVFKLADLLVH